MFSKLPHALAWLALTAVIYLLQVIPFTGIFLMILAAPFWSIITVNAGFFFLALEALARPQHRMWLLAPALYLIGYVFYANQSHQEFARLDAEFREFNAGKSVAFDPRANDLVIAKKADGLGGAALTFVRDYDLEVAYVANANYATAGHIATRIGLKSICDGIRKNPDARAARIYGHGLHIDGKISKTHCSYSGPEDPRRPAVRISIEQAKSESWLLPATIHTLTIKDPYGRVTELKTGQAAPLPWIPMPVMGCALNSGAPSWDCFQGFFRLRQQGLGATGTYGAGNIQVLADAMGLQKTNTTKRAAAPAVDLPRPLQENIVKRADLSLENLKTIIADPTARLTYHDIKGLHESPERWAPLIPGMIDALGRAFDIGAKARERAGMLQDLFNRLPAADYRPVGEKILSALSARPDLKNEFVRPATLERLAELGLPALPLLEHRLFANRVRLDSGAVLGLCKIGTPASRLAGRIADAVLATQGNVGRDMAFVVYITLLRFGRVHLAEVLRSGKELETDTIAARVARKITPASSPDVCVSRGRWHKLLRKTGI
ncbi:MAG: hypothetical protein KJ622_02060 [Alphaproteobacteria bacterium]|nr:hypothetical protein [Alphaproteobacteria bacterium]